MKRKLLIGFFSNAVINLKILKFENFNPLSKNIDHPTLKAIVKYRKHPSIIAINPKFTKACFSFNTITIEAALKEISVLDTGYCHISKGNKRQQYFFKEQMYAYFN